MMKLSVVSQMDEICRKISDNEAECDSVMERLRCEKGNMEQIVRFSSIDGLTQEVVDTFVKKITLYKDKRVEIEWNFAEGAFCEWRG